MKRRLRIRRLQILVFNLSVLGKYILASNAFIFYYIGIYSMLNITHMNESKRSIQLWQAKEERSSLGKMSQSTLVFDV